LLAAVAQQDSVEAASVNCVDISHHDVDQYETVGDVQEQHSSEVNHVFNWGIIVLWHSEHRVNETHFLAIIHDYTSTYVGSRSFWFSCTLHSPSVLQIVTLLPSQAKWEKGTVE